MSDPLATYLHDHLSGSAHAIDLLHEIRNQYASEELGEFAGQLLPEIEADRAVLQKLADRVGDGSNVLKETVAWAAEKVSRLKLNRGANGGLGTFEALEFLELGIHGKWALWRALSTIAPGDGRFREFNFEHLAGRAAEQHAAVEGHRLEAARVALAPVPAGR